MSRTNINYSPHNFGMSYKYNYYCYNYNYNYYNLNIHFQNIHLDNIEKFPVADRMNYTNTNHCQHIAGIGLGYNYLHSRYSYRCCMSGFPNSCLFAEQFVWKCMLSLAVPGLLHVQVILF